MYFRLVQISYFYLYMFRNQIFQKSFRRIFLVSVSTLLLVFSSCRENDEEETCIGSNNDFQLLFNELTNNGYEEKVSMDTEVHQYSFILNEDMNLCKIGYQSYEQVEDREYLIEIIDSASGDILMSQSSKFSADEVSYLEPNASVRLEANTKYSIRRVLTDWSPYISNTIGHYVRKDSMEFPYAFGVIRITDSYFYQGGGPIKNFAIPYIELVFK